MATKEKHKTRSGYSSHRRESEKHWWFMNSGRWAGIASGRKAAVRGQAQ